MKLVEVEAVEDRSRAEGGYAVILLRDVGGIAGAGRFRLRPLEADETEAAALANEDFTPVEVDLRADGLALTVGPDVTEKPQLVPGSVVEITLPEAGVRGEVLWPAVAPQARPKRRNIMVRRAAGDPLPQPINSARAVLAKPVPSAAATALSQRDGNAGLVGAEHFEDRPSSGLAMPHAPRRSVVDPVVVKSSAFDAVGPATSERAVVAAAVVTGAAPGRDKAPAPAVLHGESNGETASGPARASAKPVAAGKERARSAADAVLAASIGATTSAALSSPVATDVSTRSVQDKPAAQQDALEVPSLESVVTRRPRRAGRAMTAGSTAALAVAVLVAGQIVAMRALDLSLERRSAQPAATVPPAEPGTPPEPPSQHEPKSVGVRTAPNLYDLFVSGPASPRGVPAEGVSPARALQQAHKFLHGAEAERDAEEAIYWLKLYLAGTSGGDHARIALTQLGSAYAQPIRGERDFASARIVWELAAAFGDPVAMCFLGAIHGHGLGVPPAQEIASGWYDRAAAKGRSCASAEAASAPGGR